MLFRSGPEIRAAAWENSAAWPIPGTPRLSEAPPGPPGPATRAGQLMRCPGKRTSDCGECYFQHMCKMAEKQHTPILTGFRNLAEERGWEVDVVPLVVGQRSVREEGWLESLRIFVVVWLFIGTQKQISGPPL